MYFKIKKGSETEIKFKQILDRADIALKEAIKIVKELGVNQYIPSSYGWGGIEGFVYEKGNVPPYYKKLKKTFDIYYPKVVKENKEILSKIKSLPIVRYDEISDILSFKDYFVDNKMYTYPGIRFDKETCAYFVPDELSHLYVKIEDAVEITREEYNKIGINANNEK